MKIAVFGLGYVGTVSAACLADRGHQVIGVDVNVDKVALVNAGRAPVVEARLEALLAAALANGTLRATTDSQAAVAEADLSLICVGTPGDETGRPDLQYVQRVAMEIGRALGARASERFHIVVVRSTVPAGTVETVVAPLIQAGAGLRPGAQFGVVMHPEFMREGSAVHDYFNPPFTVIGAADERSYQAVARLYTEVQAPLLRLTVREAEMLKYASNSFHALKVCFANEIGSLCKQLGIDGRRVMTAFVQDTQLNISSRYLQPGFAFGGPCLPKDVRALGQLGRTNAVDLPLLQSIIASNERQVERVLRLVRDRDRRRIGIFGLSFKPGTDDLRESPLVLLAQRLLSEGFALRIFDENVSPALLVGSNRVTIERNLPGWASLLVPSIGALVDSSDLLIIGHRTAAAATMLAQVPADREVVDLVGIEGDHARFGSRYHGLCW